MNQTNLFSQITFPITALITTNTRLMLLRRTILFPAIIAFIPLIPVIVWRIVIALYDIPFSRGGDPVFLYNILSASMYMQFVIPILALLRGMSTMSEEIDEGTLIFIRLRPVPRTMIVLGKFLSYVLSMSILVGISLFLTYCILSSAPEADMFMSELTMLYRDMRVFLLGLIGYGALMMFLGILFKRSLMAGCFYLFIWDTFAAFIPGSAHKLTVKHYLQSIFPRDAITSSTQNTEDIITALLTDHPPETFWKSVIILLIIGVIGVLLTALTLSLKEFKGGQQEGG